MDDLENLLGIKYSPEQQATLKELARRANDRIRVQNLINEDYFVEWDTSGAGGRFVVPGIGKDIGYGLGQAVHQRYIAFKFFKEIAQVVLSAEMKMQIDAENDARRAKGMKAMDKTFAAGEEGEEHFVATHGLRTDNATKLMELLPRVILGVEEEYGLNPIPYKQNNDQIKWEQVMEIINRPVKKAEGTAPVVSPPIVDVPPAEDIVSEVAQ